MIKILKNNELNRAAIFRRAADSFDVTEAVSRIIADVKVNGDAALVKYCEKFDKARLASIEVSREEIEEAKRKVSPEFIRVLREAAENIRAFHSRQVRTSFIISDKNGIITGQKITPIEKVGIYVPGGTAAYPSTVLMDCIPAKIAGCAQLCITTPPSPDGKVNPAILTAADLAGVDRICKVGGAQAVAALAYGTETVPKVDKIVGPGNAFVAEAKRQVNGLVSIDMIAGPSEILVVADADNNPAYVAADMLSQAEHDKNASAVLITDSEILAEQVSLEIARQLPELSRCEIARASIEENGKIIVTDDLEEAYDIANEIAPEHIELCVASPFEALAKIKNAGSIFMGRYCPEALGDYLAGPNHTLPTGGTARFSSPLSVDDFVKKSQYTYYNRQALAAVAEDIALFARMEGLTGHARSAVIRFAEGKE